MQDTAPDMSGECIISSVLFHCSKDLNRRTSVTALLQLSFIQQQRKVQPQGWGQASLRGDPPANVDSVMVWSQVLFMSFYVRCQNLAKETDSIDTSYEKIGGHLQFKSKKVQDLRFVYVYFPKTFGTWNNSLLCLSPHGFSIKVSWCEREMASWWHHYCVSLPP